MYFQLNGDITHRIVKLIYDISGYSVAIWNDQGVIVDSTEKLKADMTEKNVYNLENLYSEQVNGAGTETSIHHCEKNIRVDGEVIGRVIIGVASPIGELLATLAAEFIAILVQERDSCKDMYSLVREYETLFDFVPAQIMYKDTKNNFIRVNKQVEKDLGIPVGAFPGRSAEELFPAYAEQYYRDDLVVINSGKPMLGIVEQINTGQNEMRWMSTNKFPTFNIDGSVSGLIALVLDITENQKIEEQHSIWAKIFESSGEAISVTDTNNNFVTVNQAFCDATGYSFGEIFGKNPRILKSDQHDKNFYQNMWASINQAGVWQGEIWDKRKDDTVYLKWLRIDQIKDKQGKVVNYLAMFNDISEQKAAEERIAYLDRHDALTGLPNRSVLADQLGVVLQKASINKNHVGVISIDLDRFKNINDSLGHEVGDEFLKEIAKRLESYSKDKSVIGRFGGDTFVIILPDVHTKSEIVAAINKVKDVIAQPVMYGQVELMVTASAGISVFPEDGDTPEVLIRNADTAMHKAKDIGRNNYQFFTAIMNEYASEQLMLENSLRRAIERKEFVLFYQPQLDVKTGKVVGAEALIRWSHPIKKIVSPLEFIPLAEETGLIIPIGEWVLMEACRQHQEWVARGLPPIPVSVNISTVQFRDKKFLQMLATVIEKSGIEPSYLDLEVTESVVMRDPEFVIEQLEKIKAMGIKLSLDDFGTGFSSFSYLRHFPLDRLKIDQSFVRNLMAEPINQAIVESIITLGKNLKIRTIAEGVETIEELHCVQQLQCDEIQGYYYSKPLPSDEFITWFQQQTI